MTNKKLGTANTNESGLKQGEKYIIESNTLGIVDVYSLEGVFLFRRRLDCFDNIRKID